jgi:tRNA-modifying protein YgfZ
MDKGGRVRSHDRDLAALLASGEAFTDLSFWRKIAVSGTDAFLWLNDLVSSDISDLVPGRARRALLLSPTGRVRAEFTVAVTNEGVLLIQDPSQPEPVGELLERYILSSDVRLEDRTGDLALVALPGLAGEPEVPGATPSVPSCLGLGIDLLALGGQHDRLIGSLQATFALAGGEDVETWRVRAGIPRFGVDGTPDDLPQECGMQEAVAFGKGCYLGQEAMAKVRNLGHPRRVLVHLEAPEPVAPGQTVTVGGRDVGEVTSAAGLDGGTVVLARVAWDAREGPFETSPGGLLSVPATTRAARATARSGNASVRRDQASAR